jgi:large subunit ribosomal protein L24e
MTIDATLDFEKRRNRPLKYNRERMEATIRAMKRIADIKHKREVDFYSYRFRGNRRREKAAALRELQQNISLIEAPASLRKKATVEITAVAPTKKKTITNKKKSASQQMQD